MSDKGKVLINIPADGNYIEILGYKIDGFKSFEAFCEHLKKYAEMEEEIKHLKADKEALINGQETLQKTLATKIAESEKQSQNFKVLVSDHRTLHQSFDNLKGLYEAEKAKVEKAKEKSIYFAKELQKAKAEIESLNNLCNEQNAEIKRLIEVKNRLFYNLKSVCEEKEKVGEG